MSRTDLTSTSSSDQDFNRAPKTKWPFWIVLTVLAAIGVYYLFSAIEMEEQRTGYGADFVPLLLGTVFLVLVGVAFVRSLTASKEEVAASERLDRRGFLIIAAIGLFIVAWHYLDINFYASFSVLLLVTVMTVRGGFAGWVAFGKDLLFVGIIVTVIGFGIVSTMNLPV